jgi:sulfur transfer protein SufE
MNIHIEDLAKALKVSTIMTEKDEETASDLMRQFPFITNRNSAYEAILKSRVLDRITELVEKVEKLDGCKSN